MLPLSSVGLQKAGHATGSRRTGEEKQKPKVIIGFLPEKVSGESDLASLPPPGGSVMDTVQSSMEGAASGPSLFFPKLVGWGASPVFVLKSSMTERSVTRH